MISEDRSAMANEQQVTADEARALLDGATPGLWEVLVITDARALPSDLAVVALDDPRSYRKPDGTWHAATIARGMDGPTREPNARLIAAAPSLARTVIAQGEEIERLRAIVAGRTTPPTNAEVGAHRGEWLVTTVEDSIVYDADDIGVIAEMEGGATYRPLLRGAPCAWPVVKS